MKHAFLDKHRLNKLVENMTGTQPRDEAISRIIDAYCEPHRHYHDYSHIEHCLREFDEVRSLCESPDEVEFAIWFHDVIYDPHRSDNEEMSALDAKKNLTELSCSENKVNKVQQLILITSHDQFPVTQDAKIIVDIDLSILGQPSNIFDIYEKNIRAEYFWVPEEAYRVGRSKILSSFLDRSPIYYTDRFEKLYGNQARENLINTLFNMGYNH